MHNWLIVVILFSAIALGWWARDRLGARAATTLATAAADGGHETHGQQGVAIKEFVCQEGFTMTGVSRGAWLSMLYLTLLALLAIAMTWAVVQLQT